MKNLLMGLFVIASVTYFINETNEKHNIDTVLGQFSNRALATGEDDYGNYPLYEDVCGSCVNEYGQSGVKFHCELAWSWCTIDNYSFNCTYGFC